MISHDIPVLFPVKNFPVPDIYLYIKYLQQGTAAPLGHMHKVLPSGRLTGCRQNKCNTSCCKKKNKDYQREKKLINNTYHQFKNYDKIKKKATTEQTDG